MKIASDEVENFFFKLLQGAKELRIKEKEHRYDFLQLMLDLKSEKNDEVDCKDFFVEAIINVVGLR